MTSTNSLNNKSRFLPQLKAVIKRNILLCALFQGILALISLGAASAVLSLAKLNLEGAVEGSAVDITSQLTVFITLVYFSLGILWLFVLVMNMYRELMSKRASVLYFSMPIKRETYFNTNMLFGVCNVVLSFVIVTGLALLRIKANSQFQEGLITLNIGKTIGSTGVTAACLAAVFAYLAVCAVLSGRKWQFILLALITLNSVASGLSALLIYINSIWGFGMSTNYSWLIAPSGAVYSLLDGGIWKYLIAAAIQFIIAYIVGIMIFKKRKAEIAEISISGKIVPLILIGLCQLSFAFRALSISVKAYIGIPGAMIAVLVVTLVLGAVFYKKAFTKDTAKCLIGSVVITLVVVACVELIPKISYIEAVPQASEVESVTLDENAGNSYINDQGAVIDLLNDFAFMSVDSVSYDDVQPDKFTFKSDEAKAKVEALHKKIVEQSVIDNYGSEDYDWYGYYSFSLEYKLKDGSTLKRVYSVATNDILLEFADLMHTREALEQTDFFGGLKEENMAFICVNEYSDGSQAYEDGFDSDYIEAAGSYAVLSEYDTLRQNIIKDRLNETQTEFVESLSWQETDFSMATSVYKFFGELKSYSDFSEEELEKYFNNEDNNDADYELILYAFLPNISDETKKKMESMTPEEMTAYEYEQVEHTNSWIFDERYIDLFKDTDKNTIAYLKSVLN